MSQILTDEEITLIVRECARGSSINRDGSTSHRIARAIEAAVINKLNSAEPVAWYNPNEDHSDEAFMWDKDTSGDHLIPVFTHLPAPSGVSNELSNNPLQVPDGYQLVPIASTPAMHAACREARASQLGADTGEHSAAIWTAMLAAARSEE